MAGGSTDDADNGSTDVAFPDGGVRAFGGIDVFCRVVDNFGDIGVCWRLARQLRALMGSGDVRLWVDDLATFRRIQPNVDTHAAGQTIAGVEIVRWADPAPDLAPRGVAVEAFACCPPDRFIERLRQRRYLWINLEYLSAETWVERCHARPSMQPNGMVKTFFFPGFTPATGGLPREGALLARRDRWLADPAARWSLLRGAGLPPGAIQSLRTGALQVFLFCYRHAPAQALIDALDGLGQAAIVIMPDGVMPGLRATGRVQLCTIPFVTQDAFDRLLWSSDLNVVRGEDSLVRATWAGKPLIWHIYPQSGQTHRNKLAAWLRLANLPASAADAILAWNAGDVPLLRNRLDQLLRQPLRARWHTACRQRADALGRLPDLATTLLAFCATQWRSR
ncbi:MAG: elongation factor P maturation arginine rhamnosyltransferase EarP [Candidimonas sp.]|nr:MAG: elongation factor P maturation arginine rhamnosyltransferase EarP [Candidimonas sp.]